MTQVLHTSRPLCSRFPPGCPRIFSLLILSKTEFLIIGLKQQLSKIDNSLLNTTHSARNLGFIFDEHLTLSVQILSLSKSCYSHMWAPLYQFLLYLDSKTASTIASFRQSHSFNSPPGLPHPAHITSSQSPSSLSQSVNPSVFYSFVSQILSTIVILIPSGLTSRILYLCWIKWSLAFVCFSFFFFLATCARLSWIHSAFESMWNSAIVSYRIVLHYSLSPVYFLIRFEVMKLNQATVNA